MRWRVVADLSPFRPETERSPSFRWRWLARLWAWRFVSRTPCGEAWIIPDAPGVDVRRG